MKTPVVLRVYKSDQLISVKQFTDEQIVIGRQPDVQVAVDDPKASIIHAAIEERDSGYYICDLGSETGTFHNGQSILDAKLEAGDQIRIGDLVIEFFVGAPKPKAPPPRPNKPPPKGAAGLAKVPDGPPSSDTTSVETPSFAAISMPEQESGASKGDEPFVLETVAPPKMANSEPLRVPDSPKANVGLDSPKANTSSGPQSPQVTQVTQVAQAPQASQVQRPATAVAQMGTGGASASQVSGAMAMGSAAPSFLEPEPTRVPGTRSNPGASKSYRKKKRRGSSFAPPSKYTNVKDFVRPSKGTVVQVLIAWKERVISTFHFSRPGLITMGSHPDNDVVLPIFISKQKRVPLVKIDGRAIVMVSPETTGELVKQQGAMSFVELVRQNRMVRDAKGYQLVLDQGEMIRIDVSDQVSVIIRYTSDSPKPLAAPLLDLTTAEFTAMMMAFVMVAMMALYQFLYPPPDGLDEEKIEEPVRTALIINKPPPKFVKPPSPPPPPEPEKPAPTPEPPKVKSTPIPKPVEKPAQKTQQKAQAPKNDPGAAQDVAPNKNKTGPKQLTSVKQGGATKVGDTAGAQMQGSKKDVSKSGVFSVFGGGGKQDELSQSYSGAGEIAGMADAASGRAGQNEDRAGDGIGSALKDTGRGGNGVAQMGVAGAKTKGRGGGDSGFGQGGLGTRKGVEIVPGGMEESFSGSVDREAVRRVIMNNMRAIKSCYERELNRSPDLHGKVVIGWEVGEQGRVLSTRVKSNTMNNASVAECIASRLRTWRFPEPPRNEEYSVDFPFVFSSN